MYKDLIEKYCKKIICLGDVTHFNNFILLAYKIYNLYYKLL